MASEPLRVVVWTRTRPPPSARKRLCGRQGRPRHLARRRARRPPPWSGWAGRPAVTRALGELTIADRESRILGEQCPAADHDGIALCPQAIHPCRVEGPGDACATACHVVDLAVGGHSHVDEDPGARSASVQGSRPCAAGTRQPAPTVRGRRRQSAHDDGGDAGPLQDDLLVARKARRPAEVSAVRSLLAALANAEAVAVPAGRYRVVTGRADVPRRSRPAPMSRPWSTRRSRSAARGAIVAYGAAVATPAPSGPS